MQTSSIMKSKYWRIATEDLVLQKNLVNHSLQQTLPEELGKGYSNIFQIANDLSFIETHFLPTRDLAILSQIDSQDPRMVITLDLVGQSRFRAHHGQEVVFTEGYTSITTFNSTLGERHYHADRPVTQLRFVLTQSWLEKYLERSHDRWFRHGTLQQISHRPTTQSGFLAAQQLLKHPVSGELNQLLLHAQALSILAAELEPLCAEYSATAPNASAKDHKLAEAIRAIFVQEFKNPPSLTELAKRLGTNQFKLKQVCHQCLNTTPYGLLAEIRMHIAYQMLATRQYHVGVVADFVGFAHASNFSAAFVKFFGVSPKSLIKKSRHQPNID